MALESGHPADHVEAFLQETLPGGLDLNSAEQATVLIADARGEDVDPDTAQRVLNRELGLPSRARVHLALARTYYRQDCPTAAVTELGRARSLLTDWPGWLLTQVEEEAARVAAPVRATPAQRRVLDLLAEGLTNGRPPDAQGHATASNALRHPVAEFRSAVFDVDQIEPAEYRAIFGDKYVEGANAPSCSASNALYRSVNWLK